MGINRIQLELCVDTVSAGVACKRLRIRHSSFSGSRLDEHWWQASQVRRKWVDDGIIHRVSRQIGACTLASLIGGCQRLESGDSTPAKKHRAVPRLCQSSALLRRRRMLASDAAQCRRALAGTEVGARAPSRLKYRSARTRPVMRVPHDCLAKLAFPFLVIRCDSRWYDATQTPSPSRVHALERAVGPAW